MTVSSLTGLEQLRMLSSVGDDVPHIGRLLGMSLDELEHGRVVFSLITRPDFSNPMGNVHGGICATLLDSVMGCAVHTTLGPGEWYATLEIKVNYTGSVPVSGVRLQAVGEVVHVGGRVATAEGRVTDPEGRLVAHATTTCLITR